MAVARDELKLISDYFRVRAQKYEVLGQLPQSRDTFFISGYIPQKKVDTLRKKLESKYDIVIDVEDKMCIRDSRYSGGDVTRRAFFCEAASGKWR